MKTNCYPKPYQFDMNDAKTLAKTAIGAYDGFKKGGVPGAVVGGYIAYRNATKNNTPKSSLV